MENCIGIEDHLLITDQITGSEIPITTKLSTCLYDWKCRHKLFSKKVFYSCFNIEYNDSLPDIYAYGKCKQFTPDISISNDFTGNGKHYRIKYNKFSASSDGTYTLCITINDVVYSHITGITAKDLSKVHLDHMKSAIRSSIIDFIDRKKRTIIAPKPTLALTILESALEKLQAENDELRNKLKSISAIIN